MVDTDATSQVLSLKLSASALGAPFEFEHIEMQGQGMRHRIAPLREERRLEILLHPDFVVFVRACLDSVEGATMVLSDVAACFQAPGVELRELQMLRTIAADGTHKAVLRFMKLRGDVQGLLRSKQTPSQAETRAIALEAIEGVVGRTYDVACVYESVRGYAAPSGHFDGCARDIMTKRDELLFRLDLLQRAVAAGGAKLPKPGDADVLSVVTA